MLCLTHLPFSNLNGYNKPLVILTFYSCIYMTFLPCCLKESSYILLFLSGIHAIKFPVEDTLRTGRIYFHLWPSTVLEVPVQGPDLHELHAPPYLSRVQRATKTSVERGQHPIMLLKVNTIILLHRMSGFFIQIATFPLAQPSAKEAQKNSWLVPSLKHNYQLYQE